MCAWDLKCVWDNFSRYLYVLVYTKFGDQNPHMVTAEAVLHLQKLESDSFVELTHH